MTPDDAVPEDSGLLRKCEFTIPAGEISTLANNRAKEMQPTYELKGFRPGKVPLEKILQRQGPELRQEALEKLAREKSEAILAEGKGRGEQPLADPQVKLVEEEGVESAVEEGHDLRFEMRYEIRPEVPDITTLGLSLACPRVEGSEADVDAEIQGHFKAHPVYAEAEAGRRAEKGDQLLVEVVQTEDGKEVGRSDENGVALRLGVAELGEDVDKALVGAVAGDSVQVERGESETEAPAHVLEFNIREVASPLLYESSESFAVAAGFENLEQMREEGWRRVKLLAATARRRILHARLYAGLAGRLTFETPPSMVGQYTARLQGGGDPDPGGLEPEAAAAVQRGVRYLLALSELQDLRKLPPLTGQDMLRAFRRWDNDSPVGQGEQAAFLQMAQGNAAFQQLFLRLAMLEKTLDAFVADSEITEEGEIGVKEAEEIALRESDEWRSMFL